MNRTTQRFVDARRNRTRVPFATLTDTIRSADDAYRIQDAVAGELGWFADKPATIWKAGASTRESEPAAAPIPSMLLHASPGSLPASDFHMIGIEAEIALRFGHDVHGQDVEAQEFDWSRVIGEMLVGIEIVDTRLDDFDAAPALVKLADFISNGGYIIGTGIPFRRDFDWRSQPARVLRNGDLIAETRGGHSLGDPTCLLPWFVRHVEWRGGHVRAGDVVTLGTWTGLLYAAGGECIDVEFEGVGEASVAFV